jgi:hypothetical protein
MNLFIAFFYFYPIYAELKLEVLFLRTMLFRIISLALVLLFASAQVSAQVNCPPNLPLSIVGNTDYCIGSPGAELSVNETYDGYEWLPTAETNQNALLTAGNYQVVVTHYTGCTDTMAFEVSQVSNPPQPTIDVSGPTQFCQGESVVLSVPTWYPYYEWSSGSVGDEITVFASGTYNVSIEDWIGCSSSSNSILVIVDPLPTAAFSPNLNLFDIQFNNLSYDATDYEWNFGDGAVSTDFEPTHTYVTGGVLPMYLVASNNCASDTAFLELQSVGIDEQSDLLKHRVYPNPSNGNFFIEMNQEQTAPVQISIYGTTGQLVYDELINSEIGNANIQVGELRNGVYFLEIRVTESVYVERLVITD